jgi:hypothetical protein
METPEMIAQSTATPSAKPAPAAKPSEVPPCLQDRPEPLSVLTATARLDRPVETLHWSIVALTVITAMGVLIGGYSGDRSQPRELLPVVVYAR